MTMSDPWEYDYRMMPRDNTTGRVREDVVVIWDNGEASVYADGDTLESHQVGDVAWWALASDLAKRDTIPVGLIHHILAKVWAAKWPLGNLAVSHIEEMVFDYQHLSEQQRSELRNPR